MRGQGAYQAAGALGDDPVTDAIVGVVKILGLPHPRPVNMQVDVVALPRMEH